MYNRFVYLSVFALSLHVDVLAVRSVSLTVQNMTKHSLVANLANDKFIVFKQSGVESTSIDVSKKSMRLILKKSKIPEQILTLMTKKDGLEIATIAVSQQYDYPELRIISQPMTGNCVAALYATRVGGGNSYVIALGNSYSDISVEQIRSVQDEGKKQVYIPVN